MRGVAVAGLAVLLSAGTSGERPTVLEGVIDSDRPLVGPLSGEPACVLNVEVVVLERYRTYCDTPTATRLGQRYAPGATLTIDARTDAFEGEGGWPRPFRHTTRWRSGPAPAGLAEWGPTGVGK